MAYIVGLLVDILSTSTIYIIDSMPILVCRRARATRCTKVAGARCATDILLQNNDFSVCTASAIEL